MDVDELYSLLPAVHRILDAQQAASGGQGPLRELMEVLADQIAVLDESLDQFYDDQFIETCADWVTPYVGDLVGYRPVHGVVPRVASPRADVANTIRYRRRKGTAAMLEQMARDVTGWPARVVEFFERLVDSQYVTNHIRPGKGGTPDLRNATALEFTGGAFDELAHTVDVRRIGAGFDAAAGATAGRYNIPNIGIFLWRVQAVPLVRSPLCPADGSGRRFRFDPLGTDQPLYGRPRTEEQITHLAEPLDVPLPLTPRWLSTHREQYYGRDLSLVVTLDNDTTPQNVSICNLSTVGGGWAHEPAPGSDTVAIDPVLGRVCFADPLAAGATALGSWHYGAAVEVGGGGYDRGDPVPAVAPPVAVDGGTGLSTALDSVISGGVVEVQDSWRYPVTPVVHADADATVTLRASNRSRALIGASGPIVLDAAAGATVVLEGLLLAGGPVVLNEQPDDEPRHVILRHCTLVPGLTRNPDATPAAPQAASLHVLHPMARVTLERCVLGPVVAVEGATVRMTDCVVDAGDRTGIAFAGRATPGGGGPRTVTTNADAVVGDGLTAGAALTLDECTVIGRVHAYSLDVSNSLLIAARPPADAWPAPVWALRRQVGCIRFSWVPVGSMTPTRYRCQPSAPTIRPRFTSLRFGDPGYAQLRASTPDEVRRGADDESEMGVTHYLFTPQRETNLRIRLDEYLRFGLEAGPIYAS
jgi:hypothetical protein